MFGFLKDKLKGALKAFSSGVEEKGKTEEKIVEVETPKTKPAEKKQIPPKLDIKPKVAESTPKKDSKKAQEVKKDIKIKKEKILVEEIEEEVEELDTKQEKTSKPTIETAAVEEKAEPVVAQVKQVSKEEPKSIFSKVTSLFKKKEETHETTAAEKTALPEKKYEQPKMVVESIRATSDGKIVEEKTIIQTKSVAQEEEEERLKEEKLAAQKEREKAARHETELKEAKLKEAQEREAQQRLSEKESQTQPEKKSFFAKLTQVITTKTISQSQFDELYFDLEMAMLENNVAVQVIEKLKADLQKNIVGVALKRGEIETIIVNTLRESITDVLSIKVPNLLDAVDSKKPYIIAFIGVNGAGKTTNLAKVAHYLKKNGKSVVIAACDTFRAAAIQQLEEHANKLDIKIIKHDYGADAAAVAFDAVAHAKAKNIDVVLIDTAGRLHSNSNLMDELAKIERVIRPDLKLFVGESVTGNDCIEQAMQFNEKIGIDGIILSKADVDEKGGAAISVSYVTQKPIYFIGTGQTYDDLEPFNKDKVLASLDL